MGHEVRVDPAILHAIAGGADLIGDDLAIARSDLASGADDLAARLPGWPAAASAASVVTEVWALDAALIAEAFHRFAEGLRTSARNYESGDLANAANFPGGR